MCALSEAASLDVQLLNHKATKSIHNMQLILWPRIGHKSQYFEAKKG